MIYSMSFESDPSFFIRQIFYLLISIVVFVIVSRLNFQNLVLISPAFYFLVLLFLVATLLIGYEVRGSVRWIDLKIITFQAAEFMKPALILFLAYFIARFSLSKIRNFVLSFVVVAVPAVLVAKQPDLSNSILLLFSWGFMIFIGGANFFYIAALFLITLVAAPLFWSFVLKDYQKARLLTFLNVNSDPQGVSYNIVQSLIALGSGQIFGKGFGRGTQSHLNFLPEGRTDFIFAATGEELGFLGLLILISIFAFLVYQILVSARSEKAIENAIFLYTAAFFLTLQFFVNAGMNMAIFPVSGVTLPFVSYGGSSLIAMYTLLGLASCAKTKH